MEHYRRARFVASVSRARERHRIPLSLSELASEGQPEESGRSLELRSVHLRGGSRASVRRRGSDRPRFGGARALLEETRGGPVASPTNCPSGYRRQILTPR